MIAGVDFSTLAIDVVLLDEDTNHATHHHRRLDTGPGKAFARVRRVRDAMPARGSWRDSGVTAIAIEKPYSRNGRGADSLQYTLGAIAACLPTDVDVHLVRADDWRKACGLRIRGQRDELKAEGVALARRLWTNSPARIDDNAADAYLIAWAIRDLLERKQAA